MSEHRPVAEIEAELKQVGADRDALYERQRLLYVEHAAAVQAESAKSPLLGKRVVNERWRKHWRDEYRRRTGTVVLAPGRQRGQPYGQPAKGTLAIRLDTLSGRPSNTHIALDADWKVLPDEG